MQLLLQQFYNEFEMYKETINNSKSNKYKEQNALLLESIETIIKEMKRINNN